jgi:hypothetical protein
MKKKNNDRKKFSGKFIVTKSFTSHEVVAWGDTPSEAYEKALEKGIKEPVIDYIQNEDVVCIY